MGRLQLAQIVDRQRQLGVGAQLRPFVAGEVAEREASVERVGARFIALLTCETPRLGGVFARLTSRATPFPPDRSGGARSSSSITGERHAARLQQDQQVVEHVGGLGAHGASSCATAAIASSTASSPNFLRAVRRALVEQRGGVGGFRARVGARGDDASEVVEREHRAGFVLLRHRPDLPLRDRRNRMAFSRRARPRPRAS